MNNESARRMPGAFGRVSEYIFGAKDFTRGCGSLRQSSRNVRGAHILQGSIQHDGSPKKAAGFQPAAFFGEPVAVKSEQRKVRGTSDKRLYTSIDKGMLEKQLEHDQVNKLWRLENTEFISIENCDLQDYELKDLGDQYYDHRILTLFQDETGYYIDNSPVETFLFDFEVFRYDWIVDFKSVKYGVHYTIHNSKRELEEFVKRGNLLFGGFNCKHYDMTGQRSVPIWVLLLQEAVLIIRRTILSMVASAISQNDRHTDRTDGVTVCIVSG